LRNSPHDEFLELCALSTASELTREEQKRLQDHLEVCPSCHEAMKQYEAVVSKTIPALAPDPENLRSDPYWSQEQAEATLFRRLALEEELGEESDRDQRRADGNAVKRVSRIPLSVSQATWRNVWTLYAAAILLLVALGVSAYRVGIHHGTESASVAPVPSHGNQNQANQTALLQQVSDAGHEREILRSQIEQRDKAVASLRHALERQSAEIARMKVAQNRLGSELQNGQAGRQNLLQERTDLSQRLEAAEAKTQGLKETLDSLEHQSSMDRHQAAALEAKATDLTRLLHDREGVLDQQQELLAHDRDIRELMGSRDLYIAEVYDAARDGQTKKPYGRVFFTKGKSLIFYAYDLDQQAEAKGSTFQAWGRRGSDRQQALNLGVFYEDGASQKRWVLRSDDAKMLAQIDAVFITVEPNGGSHRPSGKSLLFADLRIEPNHP
jgi:Anti-sigma-K factor rskA